MFLPAAAFITNLLLTNVLLKAVVRRPGFFDLFDGHGEYGVYIKLKCFENTQEQVPKSCKKVSS